MRISLKKSVALFLFSAASLLYPIKNAYAGNGSCSRVIDKYTTIVYTWDCCEHDGTASASVQVKGVEKETYSIKLNSIGCYTNCCIPTN